MSLTECLSRILYIVNIMSKYFFGYILNISCAIWLISGAAERSATEFQDGSNKVVD
jgi:hypothetical protein